MDFSEEACSALSRTLSKPCDLGSDSTLLSLALVSTLAAVNTRGVAMTMRFGQSLLNVVSACIGASAYHKCTPAGRPVYAAMHLKSFHNMKFQTSKLVMKGLLTGRLLGESAQAISTDFNNQLAHRTTLQAANAREGQRRLLSGATFMLNSSLTKEIGLLVSKVIDVLRADDDLMEAGFQPLIFMSRIAASLELSKAGSAAALQVQGLSIDVFILVDQSKISQDPFWPVKVNCCWYNAVDGGWSFQGCNRREVTKTHVHCKCNHPHFDPHMSFSIAIDPSILICGDGKRLNPEACDDGNSESGNGCSEPCTVEIGAFCDNQTPSVCLKAYPPGEFLVGYRISGGWVIEQGTCLKCPIDTFKPVIGNDATLCDPLLRCPGGREKKFVPSNTKGRTDGICDLCKKGYFKKSDPNGSPLDECTRCPGFSITLSEGSDAGTDCRCDNLQRTQIPTSATIECVYADACSLSSGPCVMGAACSFSPSCGTSCKCAPFYYGNTFQIGTIIVDMFYGAITGTGCVNSGKNICKTCDLGYFGTRCEFKMPSGTIFSRAVQDADADGVVDRFSLKGLFHGVEVAHLSASAGFLSTSYVGNTNTEISVLSREDLDSVNPGLAPNPLWHKSNLLSTDPRYICAPTGSLLAADFILKLQLAGLAAVVPLQLLTDAAGVVEFVPPRYSMLSCSERRATAGCPREKDR